MKKLIFILPFLFVLSGSAQVAQHTYFIQFTDKANTPFSTTQPDQYLSQRAIDRRVAQGVAIQTNDLPVDPNYIAGVEQLAQSEVRYSLKWFNGVVITLGDTFALPSILSLPYVDSLNSVRLHATNRTQPMVQETMRKSPSSLTQSGSGRSVIDYGASAEYIEMLSLDYLHDQGFTGEGMQIAVMDAGFMEVDSQAAYQHLFDDGRILGTHDFAFGSSNVYDHHWHGTYVMSCLAAWKPGMIVGTAPDASYYLLVTEDVTQENIIEEYNWAAAAEWADSAGADIFNTSLGYTTFDDSTKSHTYADMDGQTTPAARAANTAATKGILVVNSAGNWGGSEWRYMGTPSDADSVLSVGAVYSDRSITGFSSHGPASDGDIKPNVCAQGGEVPISSFSDSITFANGTSFSGPILAGAAACFWQSDTNRSAWEIFKAIEKSADRFNTPDSLYGYGIPNFELAGYLFSQVEEWGQASRSLTVYPNPTSDFVLLPLGANPIDLRDMTGARIELRYSNGQLDMRALSEGIYFLACDTSEGIKTVKVIKVP